MRFTGDYLYRVRVTSYPEGAGWRPVGNYTEIMGTSEFIWPVTNKVYGSRSTAKKRADLLESYGATAVVEQSSRIVWPEPEAEECAA